MTKTLSESTSLVAELTALLRLTRAEAQTARLRVTQARREQIRVDLQSNAAAADARADRIQAAIRRLGGVPDVFADAIGRLAAATKATFEQAQPFSNGLLGDLALEHQLRDRASFVRVLAETQDQPAVATLMHQLELAHRETIEWINVRLAEVAQGGPAALSPTPTQAVVGVATRIALFPSRGGAALVNQTVNLLQRGRGRTEQVVEDAREQVTVSANATGQVAGAARNAALAKAEKVAPSAGVRKAARQTRDGLGVIPAADLPVSGFESLRSTAAIKAVARLNDAEDIRLLLRFEQAHKNRKGVSAAAQKQLSELADRAVTA